MLSTTYFSYGKVMMQNAGSLKSAHIQHSKEEANEVRQAALTQVLSVYRTES